MSTPATSSYKVTFLLQKKEYKGSGNTFASAIRSVDFPRIVSAGVLKISKGKESKERIISPILLRKIVAPSPTVRDLAIKNLEMLFGL